MHYDGNWNHFINIFIYLSDVDQQSGPHTLYAEVMFRITVPEYYSTEGINAFQIRNSHNTIPSNRSVQSLGKPVRSSPEIPAAGIESHPEKNPGWHSNCFIQIHLHLAVDVTGLS